MIGLENYTEPVYKVRRTNYEIIGATPSMIHLFNVINFLGNVDVPVIVVGEEGTERVTVARALHYNGRTVEDRIKTVTAAKPEEFSIESIRNAFQSENGTLVIEDIARLTAEQYRELSEFLEQRKRHSIFGANEDVRLVGTALSLEELTNGQYQDVLRALHAVPLVVPPLRERKEDIPLIATSLAAKLQPIRTTSLALSQQHIERMATYAWPGNVRQIEDVLRKAHEATATEVRSQDIKPDGVLHVFETYMERILSETISVTAAPRTIAVEPKKRELPPWYSSGIMPIDVAQFSQNKGAYPAERIMHAIREGRLYAEKLGGRVIAYLTPATRGEAIDSTMKLFRTVDERYMHDTRFDPRKPFEITTLERIARFTGEKNTERLMQAKAAANPFFVPFTGDNDALFVVTEEKMPGFIPEGEERKREVWQRRISRRYVHFTSWVPGRVATDIADDMLIEQQGVKPQPIDIATILFPNGAVAIPASVLYEMQGVTRKVALSKYIRSGVFYADVFKDAGKADNVPRVIILEPGNLTYAFSDEASLDLARVKDEMQNGTFSQFARQGPWKVYDAAEICRVIGTFTTDARVFEELELNAGQFQVIPTFGAETRSTYYALKLDTARYAVPRIMEDWIGKVKLLQQDIAANAQRQRDWLVRSIDQIAATADAAYATVRKGQIRIPVEIPKVEEALMQDLQSLFPNGAVPIATTVLSELEGAKQYGYLYSRIKRGAYVCEVLKGNGEDLSARVIMLQPKDLDDVFKNAESPGRAKLAEMMGDARFKEHTSMPWMVFDLTTLCNAMGLTSVSCTPFEELRRNVAKVYKLPDFEISGKSEYYLLNLETAQYAASGRCHGRAEKISALQQRIIQNAQRHSAWLHRPLEVVVEEPAATAPEPEVPIYVPEVDEATRNVLDNIFPSGAVPICVSALSHLPGVSKSALYRNLKSGRIYGELEKGRAYGARMPTAVMLRQEEIDLLCKDKESEAYRLLTAALTDQTAARLTQHTRLPWMLFDMSSLNEALGLSITNQTVYTELARHPAEVYQVNNFGRETISTVYLLNTETAQYAVSRRVKGNRLEMIQKLQGVIQQNVERQRAWLERPLEVVVEETTEAAAPPEPEAPIPPLPAPEVDDTTRAFLTGMFPNGAVPIATSVLCGLKGARSYFGVLPHVKRGEYYGELIKTKGEGAGPVPRVILVQPADLERIFDDKRSVGYKTLTAAMQDPKFREHTSLPWMIFDRSLINETIGIATTNKTTREELERNLERIYVLQTFGAETNLEIYLLNLETVQYAIRPNSAERVERVSALQAKILENLERQKKWFATPVEQRVTRPPRKIKHVEVSPLEYDLPAWHGRLFIKGALAVPIRDLEVLNEGLSTREHIVRPYKELVMLARRDKVYADGFRNRDPLKPEVFVLEPHTIGEVFLQTKSEQFRTLLDVVKGEIGTRCAKVFRSSASAVYDATMLAKAAEIDADAKVIAEIADEMQRNSAAERPEAQRLYRILSRTVADRPNAHLGFLYVVTVETAQYAIPDSIDRRVQVVRRLQQAIIANLERQERWVAKNAKVYDAAIKVLVDAASKGDGDYLRAVRTDSTIRTLMSTYGVKEDIALQYVRLSREYGVGINTIFVAHEKGLNVARMEELLQCRARLDHNTKPSLLEMHSFDEATRRMQNAGDLYARASKVLEATGGRRRALGDFAAGCEGFKTEPFEEVLGVITAK